MERVLYMICPRYILRSIIVITFRIMASTLVDYIMETTEQFFTTNSSTTMKSLITTVTPSPAAITPTREAEYVAADFELLLPCILGLVVTLALTMVSFYINKESRLEPKVHDKSQLITNGPAEW